VVGGDRGAAEGERERVALVQKQTVPGSTICFASGSSFALTGVVK